MELGSGVGLTTVVASMFAPVVCTGMYVFFEDTRY